MSKASKSPHILSGTPTRLARTVHYTTNCSPVKLSVTSLSRSYELMHYVWSVESVWSAGRFKGSKDEPKFRGKAV